MSPADLTGELSTLANQLRGIADRIDAIPGLVDGAANSRQTEAVMRGIVGDVRESLQHAKSLTSLLYLLKANERGTAR